MKKAIEINSNVVVFDTLPKKWKEKTAISEVEYYDFGFRDYVEPQLLEGQTYGDRFKDLNSDTFSIEVVEYPVLSNIQKLGAKVKNTTTGVYVYSAINKTEEDLALEQKAVDDGLNLTKKIMINKFESDTDNLIKQVVGNRAQEYALAEEEAISFKAAGYPSNDVPSSISSDAIANGRTNQNACDLILQMANNWRTAQMALRSNRLLSKAQAKAAIDVPSLNIIKQTWDTFIASLKVQIIE
tara:strand:- start:3967 stop:4689 length:723 start_codon:yes stop_codon:yes gene_type:complete